MQNQYLNYLVDPSFQGVNRLFKKHQIHQIKRIQCPN